MSGASAVVSETAAVNAGAAAQHRQGNPTNGTPPSHPHLVDEFIVHRTDKTVRLELYTEFIKLYNLNASNIKQQNGTAPPPPPLTTTTTTEVADLILNMKDVAGSSVGRGKEDTDIKSYFTIYAYIRPKQSSSSSSKEISAVKRKRKTFEFEFGRMATYDENFLHVNKWHLKLYNLLRLKTFIHQQRLLNETMTTTTVATLPSTSEAAAASTHREIVLAKPFLVFVNPKSGSGKAKNIYFERALPVWAEANIPDTAVFTQSANFARDYVRNMNLDDFSGIVVVSGDGLVYEIINGLMERPDWKRALKMPIGQVPGGSANALACCVAYLTGEVFRGLTLESFATQVAFNISKSISVPLDLVRYELSDKTNIYSFLTLEWAIVADVDYESEKYRYLGAARFIVGALKRIMTMRVYRGRLSFLLSDEMPTWTPKNKSIKVNRVNGENDDATTSVAINSDESHHGFKYLPPIDQPLVGSNWLSIEENFVFFLVVYLPLIAPDFIAVPESKLNDGQMHVIFIREGISRAQLLSLMNSTENGHHVASNLVEYVKIKAFRLEPIAFESDNVPRNYQSEGVMMIDGERVPYGPVQGEMMPSAANLLVNMNK